MARETKAVVVDTNVLVSAVLKSGLTRNLIFTSGFKLYAPEHSRQEIIEHSNEFLEKTGLSKAALFQTIELILSQVTEVSASEYGAFESKAKAVSPDFNDWPFFALSLHLNYPIWSNDARLKQQSAIKVYSTKDVLELLNQQAPINGF